MNSDEEEYYVQIRERHEMDGALNAAVDALSDRARALKQGIIVTRSGPATFTATLCAEIPHGTIHERSTW